MSTVDVKPTNNRKPAGKAETANESLKHALASCTRALARQPGLEVVFSAEKPSLITSPEGAKARLPEQSSKHGLKLSARAACREWRPTSPLCLTTVTTAARSQRRARARKRHWRKRSRCSHASA